MLLYHYNYGMKKFAVFCLFIILSTSACFGWGLKKDVPDTEGRGYVGTLPDISKSFNTNEPKSTKPMFEQSKDFNSSHEIKPVPRDNPAFVNIILKDNKISPYLNDINELLPQLENLLICIEDKSGVQLFNAKAFFITKTVEYLRAKYDGKPESSYVSFQKLMELATHTQSVATLRAEAEKYRPYMAYAGAGYLYNDNVIDEQLEYLRIEIEDTIVVLKEAH